MLEIFFKNCMWSNIVEKSDCETITIILKELHIFSSKAKKWEGTYNEDNRAWTHGKILLSSLHLEFFQAVHNGQGDLYNQLGVELFPFTFVFQCYSEISKSAKYSHILCWCISIPMFSITFVKLCLFITLKFIQQSAFPKYIMP